MALPQKADTGFLKGIATDYAHSFSGLENIDVVNFAEAPWGLNLELMPVQKFILKSYYGLPLLPGEKAIPVYDDTKENLLYMFDEKEMMDFLIAEKRTNLKEYMVGSKFRELILCVGRRGSKSTLASVVANYEVYKLIKMGNPQQHYGFPAGQEICITCVATSDQQAGVLFGMVRDKSMVCSYIKDRIVHSTQGYFNLQTDEDIKLYGKKKNSSIYCYCGGCSSVSLRGHNNIVVILDEEAFFIDNDGRFSGEEVYRALTPSILSFTPKSKHHTGEMGDGKILNLSSPYGKYGIFWDNFNRSMHESDTCLMFQMHTAMLNPLVDGVFLKREKRRNKVSFMCEYGGEFSDKVTSWIDDTEKFSACINFDITRNPRAGRHGVEYYMGIDLGLKNDGTGIAIVAKEEEKIELAWANVFYSGSSDVWDYQNSIYADCKEFAGYDIIPVTGIVALIKELCKWFPIKSGWFDQHNGYSLHDLLCREGLTQFRMENITQGVNTQVFQVVKMLFMDGLIGMFDHPILVKELLTLQEEKKGNNIRVEAPPKPGAHDDISDAYSRAVYECYKNSTGTQKFASQSFSKGGTVFKPSGGKVSSMSTFQKNQRVLHGANPRSMRLSKNMRSAARR